MFWIAVVPAVLSVAVLIVFVREPPEPARTGDAYRFRLALGSLGRAYWWLIVVAALFTLARFSEAFLVLKADDAGLAITLVPIVLVVMNVAYSLSAYPAGFVSDRLDRYGVLGCGALLLAAGDLVLAFADTVAATLVGVVLWGLHMGFTQGLFAALVADASDERVRGTAFGVFNFITGIVLLAASVIAGVLWERFGPDATFLAGAGLTGAACVVLWALHSTGQLRTTKSA